MPVFPPPKNRRSAVLARSRHVARRATRIIDRSGDQKSPVPHHLSLCQGRQERDIEPKRSAGNELARNRYGKHPLWQGDRPDAPTRDGIVEFAVPDREADREAKRPEPPSKTTVVHGEMGAEGMPTEPSQPCFAMAGDRLRYLDLDIGCVRRKPEDRRDAEGREPPRPE